MPFCHLAFSAPRPAIRRYERAKVPAETLGAAFRERRWSRGLEQWQAAEQIGVSVATYRNWEVNRSVPTVKHLPGAIAFLGRDWRPAGATFGAELHRVRTAHGRSLKALARELRIDWTTLRRWEVGKVEPRADLRADVERWIEEAVRKASCRSDAPFCAG